MLSSGRLSSREVQDWRRLPSRLLVVGHLKRLVYMYALFLLCFSLLLIFFVSFQVFEGLIYLLNK